MKTSIQPSVGYQCIEILKPTLDKKYMQSLANQLKTPSNVVVVNFTEHGYGVDVNALAEIADPRSYFDKTWYSIKELKQVTIAVLHAEKYCLGGHFELALMCDIIIAHPDTKIGQPEITLGLIPGLGGTYLQRAHTKLLCLSGQIFTVKELPNCVDIVNPDPLKIAKAMAITIAGHNPQALSQLKEILSKPQANCVKEEAATFDVLLSRSKADIYKFLQRKEAKP